MTNRRRCSKSYKIVQVRTDAGKTYERIKELWSRKRVETESFQRTGPVRRQKRRADASGQKKSDSDYNLDEGQERTTTRKRKTEGTRRKIPDRLTEEEKRARRLKEIGRRKERKAERAGAARGMVFFAFQLAASLAFLWLLCWMDILLMEYLLGIAGVLLVLLGITLISQLAVRGKGKIVGKVFSF